MARAVGSWRPSVERQRHGSRRKMAYGVGRKRRTKGYYSTEVGEGTWYQKSGRGKRPRSRHGRKSTTGWHKTPRPVGRRTRRGGIVVQLLRSFKQFWR